MLSDADSGGQGVYPTVVEVPSSQTVIVQTTDPGFEHYQDELISFNPDDIMEKVKLSFPFKIHMLIALGVSALAMLVWFFAGIGIGWFPWFLDVIGLFVLTVGAHYYIILRDKEFLQYHILFDVTVNAVLLLTWLDTVQKNYIECIDVWFVYPLLGTITLLLFHYLYVKKNEGLKQFLLTFHGYLTAILSVLFLIIWLTNTHLNAYPWFILPILGLLALYIIHRQISKGIDLFTLNVQMCALISVFLMCIWLIYCNEHFPWFVFPILALVALVVVHFLITRNIIHLCSNPPATPAE